MIMDLMIIGNVNLPLHSLRLQGLHYGREIGHKAGSLIRRLLLEVQVRRRIRNTSAVLVIQIDHSEVKAT